MSPEDLDGQVCEFKVVKWHFILIAYHFIS